MLFRSSNFLFNRHDLQDSGETYFPLLGMAMRMIVTMGLHRDASKWGMTGEEADRRRLLFHELLTLDRFQSLVTGELSFRWREIVADVELDVRTTLHAGGGTFRYRNGDERLSLPDLEVEDRLVHRKPLACSLSSGVLC